MARICLDISNGNSAIINVDDGDADPGNEIQNISISGNTVGIDAGGSGFNLSPISPASGEVLKWNGTSWEAATDATAAGSTLPILGNAQVVTNNGTNVAVSISGDLIMDNSGNMTIQPNAVSTGEIADGTIDNLDISGIAGISVSMIESTVMVDGENISLLINNMGFITDISGFDTDDLTEGVVNLYYADALVDARLLATSVTDTK